MCDKTQGYINSWVCAVCSDMIIATAGMNRKNRNKKWVRKNKRAGFLCVWTKCVHAPYYRITRYFIYQLNILLNYTMNGKCSTNMAVYRKPRHSKEKLGTNSFYTLSTLV